MREAFEQWWDGTGGWYRHDKRSTACLAAWDAWQAATSAQEARVRELEEALAELQRKYDFENEPDCYSEDGDYWFDCPNDIELVEGRKVGDEFDLLGGYHALPIRFRVTKAPDDESDDYEVEQALSATAREST
jgi:hypothetical protein